MELVLIERGSKGGKAPHLHFSIIDPIHQLSSTTVLPGPQSFKGERLVGELSLSKDAFRLERFISNYCAKEQMVSFGLFARLAS